jgi:hypothetical protein
MKKLNKFWALLLLITLTQCVVTKKQKNRFLEKYCTAKDSVAYVYKDSIVFVDTTIQVPM